LDNILLPLQLLMFNLPWFVIFILYNILLLKEYFNIHIILDQFLNSYFD